MTPPHVDMVMEYARLCVFIMCRVWRQWLLVRSKCCFRPAMHCHNVLRRWAAVVLRLLVQQRQLSAIVSSLLPVWLLCASLLLYILIVVISVSFCEKSHRCHTQV